MELDTGAHARAALTLQPSALPANEAATPLPSEAEPSDHLPVAAVVSWVSVPSR
jgi:hypothetical protein